MPFATLLSWQYELDPARIVDHLIRLGVAIVASGIIGMERELHGRAAGFRTHILVALGSAIIMMAAGDLYLLLPDAHSAATIARLDPGRVVQGIITGIGFLGAGVIVKHDDNRVRGLTTAASLWTVAALGALAGAGLLVLAGMGAAAAWITLVLFRYVERIMPSEVYETITVRTTDVETGFSRVRSAVEATGARVQSFRLSRDMAEKVLRVDMTVVLKKRQRNRGEQIVNALCQLSGTLRVQWSPGQE